ncbi:hypothetical protein MASR2M15_25370 [Anaerolineales bacterium]
MAKKPNLMSQMFPDTWYKRAFMRAPILLWRLGLGRLMGKDLLLLSHIGRKSGQVRRAVIECHRDANGHKYAPSGYGPRSQWYQNIQVNPIVTIQSSDGTELMHARRVTEDAEIAKIYDLLKEKHPNMLQLYAERLGLEMDKAAFITHKDQVYFVAFDPSQETAAFPLKADLVWLWFLLAVLIGLLIIILVSP